MVTEVEQKPTARLWLIFFGNGSPGWWWPFLSPGFRHVSAAAWYDAEQRWVYVDPTRRGLVIELWSEAEFGQRLGQLIRDSSSILRVPSCTGQRAMPGLSGWCVGVVKALLGLRCRALSPFQLRAHLLRIGAEVVEIERPDGRPVQNPEHTERGPGRHSAAGTGAAPRGGGQDPCDTGAALG